MKKILGRNVFLSGTDGKRKVGHRVRSEAAAGPVEEAEAESTQEASWETGKFTQLPAAINFPLISVERSVLTQRGLERERKRERRIDISFCVVKKL